MGRGLRRAAGWSLRRLSGRAGLYTNTATNARQLVVERGDGTAAWMRGPRQAGAAGVRGGLYTQLRVFMYMYMYMYLLYDIIVVPHSKREQHCDTVTRLSHSHVWRLNDGFQCERVSWEALNSNSPVLGPRWPKQSLQARDGSTTMYR